MSTNINLFDVTFDAARTIDQYAPVILTGAFQVGYGSGVRPLGVAQRDVRSGQSVPVALLGITRVRVGAAVATNDTLVVQSGTGFAISAASGAAHISAPLGRALTAAASGMLASVFLNIALTVPASGAAV